MSIMSRRQWMTAFAFAAFVSFVASIVLWDEIVPRRICIVATLVSIVFTHIALEDCIEGARDLDGAKEEKR